MADIPFYQDDTEEGLDDGCDNDMVSYGSSSPDDFLTPLQKLERYMESENIFTRQMVARGILDTLRAVGTSEEECEGVLQAMARLSEDFEPSVRSELMEQVPHITMYCQENKHIQAFDEAVPKFVLPMIVRYLTDANNQVRKTSQAALLVLLEQELVEQGDVEEQICPIILELTGPDSIDDLRTEAVALMSKMTPLVGKDITERLFLPRFAHLCSDTLFHVRKVCAANFGDMCTVVGSKLTEEHLLPKFYNLCEDGVWGVRKACAECFMQVSYACSNEVRCSELASHFVGLLCDQSRWVRMAAFQALGPFISTFADTELTGLYISEEGILCIQEKTEAEKVGKKLRKVEDVSDISREAEDTAVQYSGDTTSCDKPCDQNLKQFAQEMDVDKLEENKSNVIDKQFNAGDSSSSGSELSYEEIRAQKYTKEQDLWSIASTRGSEADLNEFDNENESNKELTPKHSMKVSVESNVKSSATSSKENVDQQVLAQEKETKKSSFDSDHSLNTPDKSRTVSRLPVENVSQPSNIEDESIDDFNSFNYWRPPLPKLEISVESDNGMSTDNPTDYSISEELDNLAQSLELQSLDDNSPSIQIHTANENTVHDESEMVTNFGSTHVLGHSFGESSLTIVNGVVRDINSALSYFDTDSSLDSPTPDFRTTLSPLPPPGSEEQDVIPQALLENYLSMIDPSRAQTVDTEIVRHCAYSFPAVAYTLGKEYWYCLKGLYETLACDMQWKVRRTLAFSIHELAVILGPDVTTKDLVPIFNGFLKDLDEVRIGVLKHLADFLRLLEPELRQQYLTKISSFMNTDNNRNWRFRLELAEQLIYLCELFSPEDIAVNMVPLALQLAAEKVSEVRNVSFRVLSLMLRRLRTSQDPKLAVAFVNDLIEQFADSDKWFRRQTFARLCYHIMHENAMEPERFAKDLLPSLLALANDSIPNVKIAVSRSLSQSVLPLEYFTCYKNPHHEDLLSCIQRLKSDADRDVRYYASLSPQTDIEHHDTVVV